MTTPLTPRLAKLRRSVERAWGEEWIFRPMVRVTGPNAGAVADTGRAVVDPVVGIYEERPALAFESARVASFASTPSTGSVPLIHLAAVEFEIRPGDRVERKATGDLFMVSEPRPSAHGRVAWRLTTAR